MRAQGLHRTLGTRRTQGTPRTDGTQRNSRGTVFHWFWRHNPAIPKREYDSSGKFIAVCRRIPISVDANSAEHKPKYGGPPKFNRGSARCADHRTKQIGQNTRQREFDKLFNAIPIYDEEDPNKFEPWLTQLENACIVGKKRCAGGSDLLMRGPCIRGHK